MNQQRRAGEGDPDGEIFELRLYLAGTAPNSSAAVSNLTALCEAYLAGRYRLETIDVLRDPRRALEDQVLVTPLLVKVAPAPACRVAGTLSDAHKVARALGIDGTFR